MKKLLYVFMSVILMAGVSCEGEEGPEGPEGPAGPQGQQGAQGLPGKDATGTSAEIYQFGDFDFTAENEYFIGLGFAENSITVEEGDVVLVYNLYDAIEDEETGDIIPYWEPLPQTIVMEDGIFQYKFIHSPIDIYLFIEATFDIASAELPAFFTDDLVFRIVVVPGEIMTNGGKYLAPVDYNNYEAVIDYYNIDEGNIREIKVE